MMYGTIILACLGILIGYLAQRSRMCFVAGVRDYILVRDGELILGMFVFIITIWTLTSIFYPMGLLRSGTPEYGVAVIRQSVDQIGSFSLSAGRFGELLRGGGRLLSALKEVLTGRFFYVSLGGGMVLGAVSTMAGGCVLRQHVLVAQGNGDALYFILGLYAATVIYYGLFFKFLVRLY